VNDKVVGGGLVTHDPLGSEHADRAEAETLGRESLDNKAHASPPPCLERFTRVIETDGAPARAILLSR
jgi:hypothetical protein